MKKGYRPKWRDDWERLVGEHKYLEVKNWHDYQQDYEGGPWTKSANNKNEKMQEIPAFHRWLVDGCRDACARLKSNIPASMNALLISCFTHPVDRSKFPTVVIELIEAGYLIPTNAKGEIATRERKPRPRKDELKGEPPVSHQLAASEPPLKQAELTSSSPATALPLQQKRPLDKKEERRTEQTSTSVSSQTGQEKPRQLPISLSNPPKFVVDDGPKFHPLKWAWFSEESTDDLRRVVYYHWKVSENDYWRKKANVRSAGQLQRAEKQMEQQTPGDFVIPGDAFAKVMVPDPNCTKCKSRYWEPVSSDSDDLVQKATGRIERVENGELVREMCDCLYDIGPKWLRELR